MTSINNNEEGSVKKLLRALASGPARFLTPAVAVITAVALVVSSYSPLVYTPVEKAEGSEGSELVKAPKEKKESEAQPPEESYSGSDRLEDGTWTGYAECAEEGVFDYYLALDVKVEGGKVTDISNVRGSATGNEGDPQKAPYSASDNDSYIDMAVNGVVSQLLSDAKGGTVSNSVDAVSGATYSSYSILSAYHDALSKAGSSSADDADTPSAPEKKKTKKTRAKSGFGDDANFADGTWTGYDECVEEGIFDYYLALDVTIKNGKVTGISNVRGSATGNKGDAKKAPYSASDNDSYIAMAVDGNSSTKGVVSQIVSEGKKGAISTSIDVVSGATFSSNSILDAYYDALKKAAKAAGSDSSVPSGGNSDNTSNADKEPTPIVPDVEIDENAEYADGEYTAYAFCENNPSSTWQSYYIGVTIAVSSGEVSIKDIFGDTEYAASPDYFYDAGENRYYLDRAIKGYGLRTKGVKTQIENGLAEGTVFGTYNTISGATYSSAAIIEAYGLALEMAIAEDEPESDEDEAEDDEDSSANGDSQNGSTPSAVAGRSSSRREGEK